MLETPTNGCESSDFFPGLDQLQLKLLINLERKREDGEENTM